MSFHWADAPIAEYEVNPLMLSEYSTIFCRTIFATGLIGLILAGCDSGGGDNGAGTGDMSLSLTDAPVDGAEAVVVYFDAIT